MRAPFPVGFAGMRRISVVEGFAVDVLGVIRQVMRTESGRSRLTRYGMTKPWDPRQDDALTLAGRAPTALR